MTCRLDRATGVRAAISLQDETCWGTLATQQNAYGLDIRPGETLRNQINKIRSELMRGDRMRSKPTKGNERPGGDIPGELQPHGPWPLIIRHLLGGSVTTVGSGPYTHSLQGSLITPDGLTIEKKFVYRSGTSTILRYYGSVVDGFELEAPTEGPIRTRATYLAKEESIVTSPMDAAPTYPTKNDPFVSFDGSIKMDLNGDGTRTAIATLSELTLTVRNNYDADQFAIFADGKRADLPEGERAISGRTSAFFTKENFALYEAYRDNSTLSMDFTMQRGPYSMTFELPALIIDGDVTPTANERNSLSLPMTFEGFRDETKGTDILVTITNLDPVLSTAA